MTADPSLNIVYEDDSLLVVNKPAELLSVPGRGPDKQDCVINRLLVTHQQARVVHRLDMSTSGLLIIPLSPLVESHISKQFQSRTVEKHYNAVLFDKLTSRSGRVDLPLICDWPNRPRQIVDHTNGKSSQTDYEVLSYDRLNGFDITRVKLTPITGRSHQLRVHMQALGHPILGDNLYATESALKLAPRLLLHAQYIAFNHPESGERLEIHSPAPF